MLSMGYNNLTNNNRIRHAVFMKFLLSSALKNIRLGKRLGSRRSMDGLVFDIGHKKVIKIIFPGNGAMANMNSIRNEFAIAKKMSDAGLGPKVYKTLEFQIPSILNLKNTIGNAMIWPDPTPFMRQKLKSYGYVNNKANKFINNVKRTSPRGYNLNLFQNWFMTTNVNYNKMTVGAAIIMENLSGAVDLATYEKTNPFPVNELIKTAQKMHSIGIAHGDLHMGNIMVQKKSNGSVRLIIIDFGRSVNASRNRAGFNSALARNFKNVENQVGRKSSGVAPAFPKK